MALSDFQQVLGVKFNDLSLLHQALTHSSRVNEKKGSASNERLEFLGDAVLGLIIAEKLYYDFPDYTEGEMTQIRAALVRSGTLFRVAKSINLGDYLFLGKGEETSGGREKMTNLESALEAIIAAVYLDQGLPEAKSLILKLLTPEIEKATGKSPDIDYKSKLQEIMQRKYHAAPSYELVDTTGPEHDRYFIAEARLGERVLGRGTGRSKKSAETEAAKAALEKIID
jgi:ribonuclease III